MFTKKQNPLHATKRYGQVDAPSVSEETLEKYNDFYNRMTEGIENPRVLVLGATPELRDIVLSHGDKLTTVDRNSQALHIKSKLMHYINNENETILNEDWLKMNFKKNSFDVIIGDGVFTALDKTLHKSLNDKLHDIIKDTGYLLLREGAVTHARPRYAPSVHIHEYRTGQYSLFDLFFGLRLYNINFKSIDDNTRKSYLGKFHEKIDEYYQQGMLSARERNELIALAEELQHTLLHKEDLEEVLRTFFFPKQIVHDIGSGHLSPWYFFLLQPNDKIEMPENVPSERVDYVKDFLASRNDSEQAED